MNVNSITPMHAASSQADGHYEGPLENHCALALQRSLVEAALIDATRIWRGDGLPLSENEMWNARRWAAISVAMMSQEKHRAMDVACETTINAVIVGTAVDIKDSESDHSAYAVIAQAVDAFALKLVRLKTGSALTSALDAVAGWKWGNR